MKIAYLVNNICQIGGVERVICKTASFLSEKYGYDVSVYSLYSAKESKLCFDISDKVRVIHCAADWNEDAGIRIIKRVRSVMKSIDADVLVTAHGFISVAAVLNKPFFKGRIVVTEHQAYDNYTAKSMLLNALVLRMADKMVLLSQINKSYYEGKGFKNCTVIPNSIECRFDNLSTLKNKTILAAGRIEHVKGFDMLADAFSKIYESCPGWKLKILGNGENMDALKKQLKALGIEEHVQLPGFVNNVGEHMADASVFVLPSRSEGLPMVLLEAMEKGLACCAFDIPAARSVIEDGSGVLVECNNTDKLAQSIKMLAQSYELRCEYAEKAKARVKDFSVEAVGEKWDCLFRELSEKQQRES